MVSIGVHLRELRQRRGISLDEISRATRIAPRYLEALESDRFSALPAPVFTRGFILAYCQSLGESADHALALYDGRESVPAVAPRPSAAPVARPPRSEAEPRSRSAVLVSFVLMVILGMALFAVGVMTRPNRDLMREVFPDVSLRADVGDFDTLLSVDKARRQLGYNPQFSWRSEIPDR